MKIYPQGLHTMSLIRCALFAAVLIPAFSTQAAAETRLISSPPRVLAFEPEPGSTQTYKKDQVVWKTPLRWPIAAIVESQTNLVAEGHQLALSVGDTLAETRLQFDDAALASAKSYCVARLADPNKTSAAILGGIWGGKLARSLTDGQFCLIDKEGDGVADFSVLINDGSPVARLPVPISPVRYRTDVGVEVGKGDYAQLVFRGKNFELEIFQQGNKRIFNTFMTTTNMGKETYQSWIRSGKLDDGRRVFLTPKGLLYLTSFDKTAKTATVEWKGLTRFKLMPVPDEVEIRRGFY